MIHSGTERNAPLRVVERESPPPGPGEVQVAVVVSGVNPADWKARTEFEPSGFAEVVPDLDGAGVVTAVGDGVEGLVEGERVWMYLATAGRPTGTAQELTVLPAERVVRLPGTVGFDVGASLGVPAMTAHRALTVHEFGPTRLGPGSLTGRIVLVAGGAGAVGHAAIQLARWSGATVLTTVSSPEKADLARAAGAHHVLNYRDTGVAEQVLRLAPDGVDHVVELAPAVNAALDAAVVAPHACVAVYGNDGGDRFTLSSAALSAPNVRYQGLLMYTVGPAALRAAAGDITAALADRALPVGRDAGLPLTWFPLEETSAAHDAVKAGTVGKVLVRVRDDHPASWVGEGAGVFR